MPDHTSMTATSRPETTVAVAAAQGGHDETGETFFVRKLLAVAVATVALAGTVAAAQAATTSTKTASCVDPLGGECEVAVEGITLDHEGFEIW